jgi:hypothetical protein
MPLVILLVVLVGLGALTVWSGRRTRRRILGGSAEAATPNAPTQTPRQAADQLRATIDAENGRGYL